MVGLVMFISLVMMVLNDMGAGWSGDAPWGIKPTLCMGLITAIVCFGIICYRSNKKKDEDEPPESF